MRHNADLADSISVRPQADSSVETFSTVHRRSARTAPGTSYSKYIYHTYELDAAGRFNEMVDSAAGNRQYTRVYWYGSRGHSETDFESTQPCHWDPDYGWVCGTTVGDSIQSFLYDQNGNLSSRQFQDALGNVTSYPATYAPSTSNRLASFKDCSYTEDDDGNVATRTCGGVTATFSWSSDNRLTGVTWGGNTASYQYDAFGRLARANDPASGDNGVRFYLWDGNQLFAEVDSATGDRVAEYSWYPGADQLHAVLADPAATRYYGHQDGSGNVIALTSESRGLSRWYLWDEWGALTGGGDVSGWNGKDRVRFKGTLLMNTGLDLYYMRNRWYETKTGRFVSEDPIGLSGGVNPYVFAGNDPINGSDPSGLYDRCAGDASCKGGSDGGVLFSGTAWGRFSGATAWRQHLEGMVYYGEHHVSSAALRETLSDFASYYGLKIGVTDGDRGPVDPLCLENPNSHHCHGTGVDFAARGFLGASGNRDLGNLFMAFMTGSHPGVGYEIIWYSPMPDYTTGHLHIGYYGLGGPIRQLGATWDPTLRGGRGWWSYGPW